MIAITTRRVVRRSAFVRLEQVERWSRFAHAQYSRISPADRPLASSIITNLDAARGRICRTDGTVVAPVDEWTLVVLLAMFDQVAGGAHPLSKIKLFVNYAREQAADVQLALLSLDLAPAAQAAS